MKEAKDDESMNGAFGVLLGRQKRMKHAERR